MLLVNIVTVYEGWVRNVLRDLQFNKKELAKSFVYCDGATNGTDGIESVLAMAVAEESHVLKRCFYDPLRSHKMYALNHLEAMMACYRYFKELRNCSLHDGGLATVRLLEAYSNFAGVATTERLGCYAVPKHQVPLLGKKTPIEIHGVAGLASIVLRIIVTLDAELSRSKRAEIVFARKWRTVHVRPIQLPGDRQQLGEMLRQLFWKAAFPVCDDSKPMLALLQQFSLGYVQVHPALDYSPSKQFNGLLAECPDRGQTEVSAFVK
jgi:hypothetical protein